MSQTLIDTRDDWGARLNAKCDRYRARFVGALSRAMLEWLALLRKEGTALLRDLYDVSPQEALRVIAQAEAMVTNAMATGEAVHLEAAPGGATGRRHRRRYPVLPGYILLDIECDPTMTVKRQIDLLIRLDRLLQLVPPRRGRPRATLAVNAGETGVLQIGGQARSGEALLRFGDKALACRPTTWVMLNLFRKQFDQWLERWPEAMMESEDSGERATASGRPPTRCLCLKARALANALAVAGISKVNVGSGLTSDQVKVYVCRANHELKELGVVRGPGAGTVKIRYLSSKGELAWTLPEGLRELTLG